MTILVEEAIDAIIDEFSQTQLKALEINLDSGYKATYKQYLLSYNKHKTPLLGIKDYSIRTKYNINVFQHMFQQKENELALREVLCKRFNQLFI